MIRNSLLFCLALLLLPACKPDPRPPIPAPDFRLPALQGEGELTMAQHEGRVVVLTFWASWCGPCRRELPVLQKMANQHGPRGLTVLGVNVDSDIDAGRKMADKLKLSFPMVHDPNGVATAVGYPSDVIPTTFVIDKNGHIRARHQGYSLGSKARLEREIEALLTEEPQ